jgi:hypothetical protein
MKMIWKTTVIPAAIALASTHRSAVSGFARKSAETASDFASIACNLIMDVRDTYRPELHYMRGPGPKWRAKHQAWLDSEAALPVGQHRLSPVYASRYGCACRNRQHGNPRNAIADRNPAWLTQAEPYLDRPVRRTHEVKRAYPLANNSN